MPDYIETIRTRAYYLWLEREEAEIPGDALDDWLEAEAEIGDELMADRDE